MQKLVAAKGQDDGVIAPVASHPTVVIVIAGDESQRGADREERGTSVS